MWQMVRELRESGVTIILTTHYIEEAEEMADRIGVINKGELILVEDKARADAEARQEAADAAAAAAARAQFRAALAGLPLELVARRPRRSIYTFDAQTSEHRHRRRCCGRLGEHGIDFKDLQTQRELARGHLRQPRSRSERA